MYDSGLSDWTVVKMGPKRDTLAELATAVRAEGLHFGLSSHRAEHNFFYSFGRTIRSDVNDPKYASLYGPAHQWFAAPGDAHGLDNDWTYVSDAWTRDWLARDTELVEKYKPEIVYFDWWIGQPNFRRAVTEFAAFYYNFAAAHGYTGVIDFKDYSLNWKSGTRDFERGQQDHIIADHWQTDTSISNAIWGYIEHDTFKSPEFLVHQLVDIVSKNGNLLLNFGPRSDGTIPDEDPHNTCSRWARGSRSMAKPSMPPRRGRSFGEGPTQVVGGAFHDTDTKPYTADDFRFTAKGNTVYAIGMACPADGKATIHALGSAHEGASVPIANVELLGSSEKVSCNQAADALEVTLPVQRRVQICIHVEADDKINHAASPSSRRLAARGQCLPVTIAAKCTFVAPRESRDGIHPPRLSVQVDCESRRADLHRASSLSTCRAVPLQFHRETHVLQIVHARERTALSSMLSRARHSQRVQEEVSVEQVQVLYA